MLTKTFKISFCTTIKNRLHHLKQTLPLNISDNIDYTNSQFIILDYNSDDGLEDWLKKEMKHYIDCQRLVYYRTTTPLYYKRSHSRNLAFKLSDGDIICNVDADNFIGKDFAKYINDNFSKEGPVFMSTFSETHHPIGDVAGRVCCLKEHFYSIKGYDEEIEDYGFEDSDLVNRLISFGLKRHLITDKSFLNALRHSNEERISEEKTMKNLHQIYRFHKSYDKTDLILLFKDGKYHKGLLIDCKTNHSQSMKYSLDPQQNKYTFKLNEPHWITGDWTENGSDLILKSEIDPIRTEVYNLSNNKLIINKKPYYLITDKELIINIIFFHTQFINRNRMKQNMNANALNNKKIKFGQGLVYKNFGSEAIKIV